MKRKLAYIEKGRYGYVVYKDEHGDFQLYYEFGGGDCVAIINVPTPEDWTKETHRPLEARDEILTFIGEQLVRDQTLKGYYKLSDKWIEIFSGKSN